MATVFVPGNQWWRTRSSHGRKPAFENPDQMWDACCEYFEWVENNPLQEEKVFHHQGEITRATVDKLRAMTISGLCIFLDIDQSTWYAYARNKDFSQIANKVHEIIRTQKFQGAAADLFNANIIARDLGLTDKTTTTLQGGEGGQPVKHTVEFVIVDPTGDEPTS